MDLVLLFVEGDEYVGRVINLYFVVIGYFLMIFGEISGEIEMINVWNEVW